MALPVVLLLAGLGFSSAVLARQLQVRDFALVLRSYELGEAGPERLQAIIDRADGCASLCPAELRILAVAAGTELADRESGPVAVRARTRAEQDAAALLARQPESGEAVAISAAAVAGRDRDTAVARLVRSYRLAPYLREQALWRLRFASGNWSALDITTRAAVLREALWVARMGPMERQAAQNALGDGPMAVQFAIRAEDQEPTQSTLD